MVRWLYGFTVWVPFQRPAPSQPRQRAGPGHQGAPGEQGGGHRVSSPLSLYGQEPLILRLPASEEDMQTILVTVRSGHSIKPRVGAGSLRLQKER